MDFETYRTNPAQFIDDFLRLNERGEVWTLSPYQRLVLSKALRFTEGRLDVRYLLWSEPKKSGKTMLAACLVLWWSFTRKRTEVICASNDEKQAIGRVFATAVKLIEHNPALASSATIRQTKILLSNGTTIEAVPVDYTGESGGRQTLVSYDELWGAMSESARRQFEEYTPIPTVPESWVLISTTAGFTGESELLESLYRIGLNGECLDDDLELTRAGSLVMFWSQTPRQPWQTDSYYQEQRATLRPNAYRRLHENAWVTGSESFITGDQWDQCVDPQLLPVLGSPTRPTIYAVDASTKHDSTAIVGVSLDGPETLRLTSHRIWKPTPADPLDIEDTIETYLREKHRQGNCVAIVCDPYQLHDLITRLKKAGLPIRELAQTQASTTAFSQSLFDALKGRNLRLYVAKDLRDQALNAVALETGRGWRLAKDKTSKKIDAIVALAMAVHTAIAERGVSRTTVAAITAESVPRPDRSWRDKYFKRPSTPRRAEPSYQSYEMQSWNQERAEVAARQAADARAYHDHLRKLEAAERARLKLPPLVRG
jgi:phage terminase large subunit-like protein